MYNSFYPHYDLAGRIQHTKLDTGLYGIPPARMNRVESTGSPDFKQVMSGLIENFNAELNEPDNLLKDAMSGNGNVDIHDVMTAMAKSEISEYFRSYLNIYCSDPFFLEIMPARIDKANSLLRLLNSIGFTADDMICCGDGYNDITMIETAGLGVAMANAQPLVREKADYITKSNDEDGVLHVINEFMR